jgi:uncharacterized lipoprotein YmbA
VTVLQRQYDEQGAILLTTKIDLDTRIASLAAIEKASKSTVYENRQLAAKVNTLTEEMKHQTTVLRDTQAQLDKARNDLVMASSDAKQLSQDLAAAKAEAAVRPRHASTPAGSHAGTAVLDNLRIQALKSASTGDGSVIQDKLRTKEKNEIDRLEKVIEAQKEVIDDQREKIKFWAKVCHLQHVICIDTDVSGARAAARDCQNVDSGRDRYSYQELQFAPTYACQVKEPISRQSRLTRPRSRLVSCPSAPAKLIHRQESGPSNNTHTTPHAPVPIFQHLKQEGKEDHYRSRYRSPYWYVHTLSFFGSLLTG